jgi:3',5'-cyclic AMP phosphodiesterase CpdA
MSSDNEVNESRRGALKCMAFGGAGTLFVLSAGILAPVDLALAATKEGVGVATGTPLFLQISDTHIGFNKDANPDVAGTLKQTIDFVNAMPVKPALTLHTGDITHLSKPEEFDLVQQLLSGLNISELHTVPGEHDVTDGPGTEYFNRFGQASGNKGYYSFDHGALGDDQLAWLEQDLKGRSASTPIVVFAHMPMWTIYEPWGWGTGDSDQAMSYLRRFGSVTVLNGHIHQIVQKVEGHITFHTARSTAYPQPIAGNGPGPGPLMVPRDQLPKMLGVTSIKFLDHPFSASLTDTTIG